MLNYHVFDQIFMTYILYTENICEMCLMKDKIIKVFKNV